VFKRLGGVSSRELIKEPGNANIQKRKDTHTMHKDNVIELKKPERFVDDPITEVLRKGARKLLAEALEVEIEDCIGKVVQGVKCIKGIEEMKSVV
jgi:hypothetical protein